uniref:Uncharacterized protein n=1 Tax=Desertifilum tharense IPPAS B-1220 TaxID=1781255 RepID=A0ACD5GY38_9CYAN
MGVGGKKGVGSWELGVGEKGSWELGVREKRNSGLILTYSQINQHSALSTQHSFPPPSSHSALCCNSVLSSHSALSTLHSALGEALSTLHSALLSALRKRLAKGGNSGG